MSDEPKIVYSWTHKMRSGEDIGQTLLHGVTAAGALYRRTGQDWYILGGASIAGRELARLATEVERLESLLIEEMEADDGEEK